MKIDDIAKQLANKVNQEHYIKHYLEKVQRGAYNKGVKDAEAKQLILSGVVRSGNLPNFNKQFAEARKQFAKACNKYLNSKEHKDMVEAFKKVGAID